jgi:hypothetical protein
MSNKKETFVKLKKLFPDFKGSEGMKECSVLLFLSGLLRPRTSSSQRRGRRDCRRKDGAEMRVEEKTGHGENGGASFRRREPRLNKVGVWRSMREKKLKMKNSGLKVHRFSPYMGEDASASSRDRFCFCNIHRHFLTTVSEKRTVAFFLR